MDDLSYKERKRTMGAKVSFLDVIGSTYAEKTQTVQVTPKKRRKPLPVILATALATMAAYVTVRAVKFRRNILYLAGFGFIDFALFSWNDLVGYAAIGVTLLILEALSGGDTT
jgi:hypothetical protein